MNLSIQPLGSDSQPKGDPILTTWDQFIQANDGFSDYEQRTMIRDLDHHGFLTIGGGAAGEFRITLMSWNWTP